jgi:hypothetical protein
LGCDWAVERGIRHDFSLHASVAYLSACRQPGLSDTPDNPGINEYYTKRKNCATKERGPKPPN